MSVTSDFEIQEEKGVRLFSRQDLARLASGHDDAFSPLHWSIVISTTGIRLDPNMSTDVMESVEKSWEALDCSGIQEINYLFERFVKERLSKTADLKTLKYLIHHGILTLSPSPYIIRSERYVMPSEQQKLFQIWKNQRQELLSKI